MKKVFTHFLALLLLLSVAIPVISQVELEYDFVTKKFNSKLNKVKSNEVLTIKVKNINTILYDIEITVNETTYHTTPPALFLQYFPTVDKIPSLIEQIEQGVSKGQDSQKETVQPETLEEALKKSLNGIIPPNTLNSLNSKFSSELKNNDTIEIQWFSQKSEDVQQKEKGLSKGELKWLDTYLFTLQKLQHEENKILITKNKLNKLVIDYVLYFNTLKHLISDVNWYSSIIKSPTITTEVINGLEDKNYALKNNIQSLIYDLYQLDTEYFQIDELYNNDSSIELQKLKIFKLLSDSVRSQINISDLISLWQITDVSNLSFVSPPIETTGDNMEIVITIKPKSDSTSIIQSSLKGEIIKTNIPVSHKFQISFSTGIFSSALINEQFSAKSNYTADTISNYSIKKENNGAFVAGPTALLHTAYKFTPDFTFGGHLGVGIPITENPNPQYLAGLSFLFGNKERIGLNISYALGQVKRLSADTDDSITYKDKPSINVINRWQGNMAFSITYNIFTP